MDADVKTKFNELNEKMDKLVAAMCGDPLCNPPKAGLLQTNMQLCQDFYGDPQHNRQGMIKDLSDSQLEITKLKDAKAKLIFAATLIGGLITLGWRTFIDWLTSHPK